MLTLWPSEKSDTGIVMKDLSSDTLEITQVGAYIARCYYSIEKYPNDL